MSVRAVYVLGPLEVVDAIQELGQLNNTLATYIVGDNGASAEGAGIGERNDLNQSVSDDPRIPPFCPKVQYRSLVRIDTLLGQK